MKRSMKRHVVKPDDKDDSDPSRKVQRQTGSLYIKHRVDNITFLDGTSEPSQDDRSSGDKLPECVYDMGSVTLNGALYSASACMQNTVPKKIVLSTSTNGNALSPRRTSTPTSNTERKMQHSEEVTFEEVTYLGDKSSYHNFLAGNNSSRTTGVSKHSLKSSELSGFTNCHASSTAFTSTPNVNPENLMQNTRNASVPHRNPGNCHDLSEKIVIDGKPYATSVIDVLDDDESVVVLSQGFTEIPVRRLGETQHGKRVRHLNNDLADRISNFIREIREWEHTLTIECKNFVYSDKEWAYKTLPIVASDVRSKTFLVASLNTDCLMQSIKGCESIRTAHWLMKFANHQGVQFKMEPKGNLSSREYKFYSEFCLDQSVE